MGYRIGGIIFEKVFPVFFPTQLDLQIDSYGIPGIWYVYKNKPYLHIRKKDALVDRSVASIILPNYSFETLPIGWYRVHSSVRIFLKVY